MKNTYVKMFKELLSEAVTPIVPTVPKVGTYNAMDASNELVMNRSGGGFNNQDKKTRFGTGFGLLSDADYEVLRQKGLQYGIDIDTMPNAYQAANVIRQNDMGNYTQNLANSMGLGSGHQYVPYRSTYQDDASQQQSMEQQIDPYGFGIGGRAQGFGIRKADWERAKSKAMAMGISPEEFQKAPAKVLNMIAQREISTGTYSDED